MAEKYQNFVDGQWCDAASGESFENRNPANWDEVVGIFPKSGKQEVERAVSAARKSFDAWHDPEERRRFNDPEKRGDRPTYDP
jgi:acyl-CoA reductase-like NAD-dependent aldehyde dehydrogenase